MFFQQNSEQEIMAVCRNGFFFFFFGDDGGGGLKLYSVGGGVSVGKREEFRNAN